MAGAGSRLVDLLLGGPAGRRVSETLARVGLHGLGVSLPPDIETSGEAFFLRAFTRSCGCAVAADVGAHLGEYTAHLLGLGVDKVIAFEPMPPLAERFEKRFAADPRVILRKVALGELTGRTELRYPQGNPTSTIAARGDGHQRYIEVPLVSINVPIVTLDEALAEAGVAPDFLKIDVEGYEREVLAGAPRLIASGKVKAIQIEFTYVNMIRGVSAPDIAALLPGYQLFRLASRSLRPLDVGHYLGNIYGYSNFIALTPDAVHAMRRYI